MKELLATTPQTLTTFTNSGVKKCDADQDGEFFKGVSWKIKKKALGGTVRCYS